MPAQDAQPQPFDIPLLTEHLHRFLRRAYPRMSAEDREDQVQEAWMALLCVARHEPVRQPLALGRTLVWRSARNHLRRTSRPCHPIAADPVDLDFVVPAAQEDHVCLHHEIAGLLRRAALACGGRQWQRLELAMADVTIEDAPVGEAANLHGIDRALISRCRAWMRRAFDSA